MSERKFMRLRMLAVLSIATLALAVSAPAFAKGGPPQTPPGQGGTPPGQGGGETTLGNNLSVPVMFAAGIGITGSQIDGNPLNTGLRPLTNECTGDFASTPDVCLTSPTVIDGTEYYLQQTENTWQAGYQDAITQSLGVQNAIIDWSDNLTSQFWTPRSKIRVEVVLYQNPTIDCSATPTSVGCLRQYQMYSLSGTKRSEVFGTTKNATSLTAYRTVYSPAHLTIDKLTGPPGEGTGVAFTCVDNVPYTAEVNGAGKVIYGYNWDIASCSPDKNELLGWWRITFSLDTGANINIVGIDPGDEAVRFVPQWTSTASTLDIEIFETRKGGGKKGGGENQ